MLRESTVDQVTYCFFFFFFFFCLKHREEMLVGLVYSGALA